MSETWPARLLRAPLLGFFAFFLIWLWKPIAHTLSVLMHRIDNPLAFGALSIAMGIVGFVLVWRGLTRDELAATWLGFLGGALIWIGWFEFSFEYFGKLSGASPVSSPLRISRARAEFCADAGRRRHHVAAVSFYGD